MTEAFAINWKHRGKVRSCKDERKGGPQRRQSVAYLSLKKNLYLVASLLAMTNNLLLVASLLASFLAIAVLPHNVPRDGLVRHVLSP